MEINHTHKNKTIDNIQTAPSQRPVKYDRAQSMPSQMIISYVDREVCLW